VIHTGRRPDDGRRLTAGGKAEGNDFCSLISSDTRGTDGESSCFGNDIGLYARFGGACGLAGQRSGGRSAGDAGADPGLGATGGDRRAGIASIDLDRADPADHRARESDGEVAYHAVGFGREGYVALTFVSGLQKAEDTDRMMNDFLEGLNFRPEKAYGDALPTDRQAPNGLAGAMGTESLHKAPAHIDLLAGDSVVPVTGGVVAAVGALSLLLYVRRHMRREARRG
jgi:hypothetical protein